TAQEEVKNAAKVAREFETATAAEPARQRLQVQPILADVIAVVHRLANVVASIGLQQVGLPVHQVNSAMLAEDQIHEAGEKALLDTNVGRPRAKFLREMEFHFV